MVNNTTMTDTTQYRFIQFDLETSRHFWDEDSIADFGPMALLECQLEPEWGCSECGVEEGVGWAVLPDAVLGTGCGIEATCSSCLQESLRSAGVADELPTVQDGLPSIPGVEWPS